MLKQEITVYLFYLTENHLFIYDYTQENYAPFREI